FLPKLGVTWHANPNAAYSLLTYKGYNASGGGVSFVSKTPYKFQKEMSQTVEFVARTQWLDRRLFANANVFFTDLDGAQAIGTGPGGANDNIYLNIDKARTRGAELDFAYIPTSTMKLTFGLGLLDTKIVNFGSTANNVHNGKELGMAPRVTANVGANVEVAPNLTVGGNVVYVGKRFADYKNVAQDELASYSIVNLNTQYKMGKATLTGYVNNAFDKFAQLNRNTALNSAWFNTGRTVGAKLKLDF
ncbi:MAG: TonB-dependent receptor, partial [Rhodocyclaceae bacterium]|nr:TonB-dependent receptor [Rhodocyclaceae bacterium]